MESEERKAIGIQNRFVDDTATYLYELLAERKARNSSYSTRAFARDLGVSPAFLSQVLNGKRNLSLQHKLKLASHLGISVTQGKLGENSSSPQLNLSVIQETLEHEKILKYWYHFAILTLAQMDDLVTQAPVVAKRLGITPSEARSAIQRLLEFGYLEKKNGKYLRTKTPFVIDSKKSSQSLRQLHRMRLFAAEQELTQFEQFRVDQRHFQTLFIPSSKARVKAAKGLITQFQKKLISFLMEDQPDEVFQLSLQLFSLENKKSLKGNEP